MGKGDCTKEAHLGIGSLTQKEDLKKEGLERLKPKGGPLDEKNICLNVLKS